MEKGNRTVKGSLLPFLSVGKLVITGAVIGFLTGLVEGLFGIILRWISSFYQAHDLLMLLTLPVSGALIIWLFYTWGRPVLGRMNLIFEVDQDKRDVVPKRLATLMILSTWLTHLSGGSAGKEGVAVQVGATISSQVEKIFGLSEDKSVYMVTGMAAGFAGLFQTPFTAVFFALEVLESGSLRYAALVPSLASAFTASMTAARLGLDKAVIPVTFGWHLDLHLGLVLLVLGILFGLTARLFVGTLHKAHQWAVEKCPDPFKRNLIGSVVLMAVLFASNARYAGLSPVLLDDAFAGTVSWYDWAGKLVCTVLTLSVGFQGGEVTPLYTVGACLGSFLAPFAGLPAGVGAMLGYAAVFGSGTNTFLAPIMMGMEIFGYGYFPLFFLCCAAAWVFNGNHSIYAMQQITYK